MINREPPIPKLFFKDPSLYFFDLPSEILTEISFFRRGFSDISKALHHAAYAEQKDVNTLIALVASNPRLLLPVGNVITPGGLEIKNVTLYEFLLGAGDPELAALISKYFTKLENGEQLQRQQFEKYRPHIEAMLTQIPYYLTNIIETIIQSSAEDINAALNKDFSHESSLNDALLQFRKDHGPRVIDVLDSPCMHYNYKSLEHAFAILDREWNRLLHSSENNYNKINLVWRQIIGFEMRRFPGFERCKFIQSHPLNRTYFSQLSNELFRRSYTNIDVEFTPTITDESQKGLGFDYAIMGGQSTVAGRNHKISFEEYIKIKHDKLIKLMPKNELVPETLQQQNSR